MSAILGEGVGHAGVVGLPFNAPKEVSFFVHGIPRPGGSKRPFLNRKTGKINVIDASAKSLDWRASVSQAAGLTGQELFTGPLEVVFHFYFIRPRSHYGSGRNAGQVKASAPQHHATKPDLLKIARSTEDALTGVLWRDDAQIVRETLTKSYGCKTGAMITVREILPEVFS